jgi:REP element-mobilizing transposase RayT
MLRKPETLAYWERRLPHWEVEEGRYFVTLHLAGAVPAVGRARIREISQGLMRVPRSAEDERRRIQRHIFLEMERWLDRATHLAHLRESSVANMVAEAIDFRNRNGTWRMFEFVIMPNHLHLFFELCGIGLNDALENFKEWTARRALKLLNAQGGRFWQREWFDHWSRSDDEDERIIAYIRNNPVKARLVGTAADWPYGSWTKQ